MLSVGKVVVFTRFVAIFSKKYGSSRPKKNFGRNFCSKFVLGYVKTKETNKKVPMTTKVEGGGD